MSKREQSDFEKQLIADRLGDEARSREPIVQAIETAVMLETHHRVAKGTYGSKRLKSLVKPEWTTETPKVEGWYWIKYRGKHGTVKCPGYLTVFKTGIVLTSARNDSWVAGPNHGGWELKGHNLDGKWGVDKTLRFGPECVVPEDASTPNSDDIMSEMLKAIEKSTPKREPHPEQQDGEEFCLNIRPEEFDRFKKGFKGPLTAFRMGKKAYPTGSTTVIPDMVPLFAKKKKK